MSRLNIAGRLPSDYNRGVLTSILQDIQEQVNSLSEGFITAKYTAKTAAPTTGNWNIGDFVSNTAPAEAGGAGSKYVVIGWVCTVAGTPGTWLACRCLTGN